MSVSELDDEVDDERVWRTCSCSAAISRKPKPPPPMVQIC
jgi:hypothetical protein